MKTFAGSSFWKSFFLWGLFIAIGLRVSAQEIDSVTINGPASNPTVIISGSGFGSEPGGGAPPFGLSGSDFVAGALPFTDQASGHQAWTAGSSGNAIGLIVENYTDTEIVYQFGNALTNPALYGSLYTMQQGDPFTLEVNGVSFSGSVNFIPAEATLNFDNLNFTYDGTPQPVTVTTGPFANMPVTITYADSHGNPLSGPPTNAGSYIVTVTSNDPRYPGTNSDTEVINQAYASIVFENTEFTCDLQPQSPNVTVDPPTLNYTITYSGTSFTSGPYSSSTAPSDSGNYEETVTINDPNYFTTNPFEFSSGNSTDIQFSISAATQQVTLEQIPGPVIIGQRITLSGYDDSGLPVTYSFPNPDSTPPSPFQPVTDDGQGDTINGDILYVGTTHPQSLTVYAISTGNPDFHSANSPPGSIPVYLGATVAFVGNLNFTYSGSPQVPTAMAIADDSSNETFTYTYTYYANTNPTLPLTSATATGTYSVTVTAIDSTNSYAGTQTGTMTIAPALTVLHDWEAQYFNMTQMNTSAISGPTATFENDGIPNLLKYLYDINPSVPMAAPDRAALPVFSMTDTGDLTLTFREYQLETGITIHVQTSTDLKNWTTASEVTNTTTPPPGSYTLLPTDTTDPMTGDAYMEVDFKPTSTATKFIRLNVTMP